MEDQSKIENVTDGLGTIGEMTILRNPETGIRLPKALCFLMRMKCQGPVNMEWMSSMAIRYHSEQTVNRIPIFRMDTIEIVSSTCTCK